MASSVAAAAAVGEDDKGGGGHGVVVKKNCFCIFSILIVGKDAVCPGGLFVPAIFRESDFYLNSLIFGFEMVSCFRKSYIGVSEFSSIETKSRHTTTHVVYVIGYTKCTQTPEIIPYPGFRYTLLVPRVKWVHFLYLRPLVCIPFSTGAM